MAIDDVTDSSTLARRLEPRLGGRVDELTGAPYPGDGASDRPIAVEVRIVPVKREMYPSSVKSESMKRT
jgi:hypothetical protein